MIPASTITTALAGAVTTIVVWALKQWAQVDTPTEVALSITTIVSTLACHFTQDNPPAHPASSPAMVAAIERQEARAIETSTQVQPEASTSQSTNKVSE